METPFTAIHDSSVEYKHPSAFSQKFREFVIHLKAADRAPSTIACYIRSLEWLAEMLEGISLEDISDRDIEKVVIALQDSSKTGSRRSAATMNRIKSAFKSFFPWAFQSGIISHNPLINLRISKAASQRTIPINVEEINTLLNTISDSDAPCAGWDKTLSAT